MLFEKNDEVRVRFAPSPTGYLHIGGARTAIFNWLFARRNQGKFLLRIEDTDFSRSNDKMVQAIFDGLKWLGLNWDEEPIFQSQRLEKYRNACQQLIDANKAYYCYCSQQRLTELRQSKGKDRAAYFYDRHCRNLSDEDKLKLEEQGIPRVVRFKMCPGTTDFKDEVHGSLTFNNDEIDDFVIMRSDNIPTYHLAVVVDDHAEKISHVIRGDDHLTNTPKQILMYQALGWKIPKFAHVPLILGSDKKRMSKRHGATSVSEYEHEGYLPAAMLNFLALLGWAPGENREILTKQKMLECFDLKGINKSSAVFDEAKLAWMNSQYISRMSDETLYQNLIPLLKRNKKISIENFEKGYVITAISMLKTRLKKINDFIEYGRYFFKDPEQYEKKAVKKHWRGESLIERLTMASERLSTIMKFDAESIENSTRDLAEEMDVSTARLIHPIRVALTGFAVSPGLFELMKVLGKEVVIRRINKAIDYLKNKY